MILTKVLPTKILIQTAVVAVGLFFLPLLAEAASLSLSPGTGVYQAGSTFTARVMVNTSGDSINAAEGTLSFNSSQLEVVNVSRGSIFSLWVTEPTFSNSAGTINFSGGSPAGYSGGAGAVMNITFRAKAAGAGRVQFTNGSVLANDGRGTNVLTAMNGGSYTIQARSSEPEPEVVVEYVPPANTPAAPNVTSATHADSQAWYSDTTATLSWSLPAGITGVRTLLDGSQYTVPTKVYDTPIRTITLKDLDDGVSYFHIQFRNADGWGKVSHYRLAIDSEAPTSVTVTQPEPVDVSNPEQKLYLESEDETSGVRRYLIKIDDKEPVEFTLENATGTIALPPVDPGYHTAVVEAFDQAGNSIIKTISFTVEAFDKPVFTEYPTELSAGVIPVIKGMTRPSSTVEITLTKLGTDPFTYNINADERGEFIFIPESRFETGVYEVTAISTDVYGARSEVSDAIRIAVQEPGYVRLGAIVVSFLSVLIPTLGLLLLTILLLLWFWKRAKELRGRVQVESREALSAVESEFSTLEKTLATQEAALTKSRKSGKLTKAEAHMLSSVRESMNAARGHITKEVTDIKDLTK